MFQKLLIIFLLTPFLIAKTNNSIRISYQNLKFNSEHLGLIETSYIFNKDYIYTGIGVYSAITGKRGGFFTGGILGGITFPIKDIIFDNGVFIGGGGGGSAPQGSGLMLKLHSGFMYTYKNYDFGLNFNYIKFKDGGISSKQIGFVFDYKFNDIYFLSIPKKLSGLYGLEKVIFSPFLIQYFPINSKTTSNSKQQKFTLIGLEISKANKNYFLYLSAGGAFKGNSDGYAEYLFGIGKKLKYIKLKVAIGSGGGGRVNTKSGFIYKVESESNFKIINSSIGYMSSFKGVKALYAKICFNKKMNFITEGNKYLKFKLHKFNFSIYNESYLPSTTIRKTNNSKRLDVLNIDLGSYLNENFMIFLNAGAAYNGNSGGYAVGMFGGKYIYNNIFVKSLVGAAGGGSVDVGGGMILKLETGFKYKNLFLSLGKIKALNGRLDTYLFSFGINFDFYKGVI